MKYQLSFITLIIHVNSLFSQPKLLEKSFGEKHKDVTRGGLESIYAIRQLADGRMLMGGYKVESCKDETEPIPGSIWRRVTKGCPDEVKKMYLVYLDSGVRVLKEKIWGTEMQSTVKVIFPFKDGYLVGAERGQSRATAIVLSKFDSNDSVVNEIEFDLGKPTEDNNLWKISLNARGDFEVKVAHVWGLYNIRGRTLTYNQKLELVSDKPSPPEEYKAHYVYGRNDTFDEEKIWEELVLPNKTKISIWGVGTVMKPVAQFRLAKAGAKHEILFTSPQVYGHSITVDKWGGIWFAGTKTPESFEEDAWVARYKP